MQDEDRASNYRELSEDLTTPFESPLPELSPPKPISANGGVPRRARYLIARVSTRAGSAVSSVQAARSVPDQLGVPKSVMLLLREKSRHHSRRRIFLCVRCAGTIQFFICNFSRWWPTVPGMGRNIPISVLCLNCERVVRTCRLFL